MDALRSLFVSSASPMRVCFDSLCFASDRGPSDDGDDDPQQPQQQAPATATASAAVSNGTVITSEGMYVLLVVTVIIISGCTPVSYTHLDVYKRQMYDFCTTLYIIVFLQESNPILKFLNI